MFVKYNVCGAFSCLLRIDGVMVSVLPLSVVDCGFDPRSGQTKDYKFGICCFSARYNKLIFNDMMMRSTLY
jgi:hypothetical protein